MSSPLDRIEETPPLYANGVETPWVMLTMKDARALVNVAKAAEEVHDLRMDYTQPALARLEQADDLLREALAVLNKEQPA